MLFALLLRPLCCVACYTCIVARNEMQNNTHSPLPRCCQRAASKANRKQAESKYPDTAA